MIPIPVAMFLYAVVGFVVGTGCMIAYDTRRGYVLSGSASAVMAISVGLAWPIALVVLIGWGLALIPRCVMALGPGVRWWMKELRPTPKLPKAKALKDGGI